MSQYIIKNAAPMFVYLLDYRSERLIISLSYIIAYNTQIIEDFFLSLIYGQKIRAGIEPLKL